MNKRGQGLSLETIIKAALVLFVLVSVITILNRGFEGFTNAWTGQSLKAEFEACRLDFKKYADTKGAILDNFDVDKDGCADTRDNCVFTEAELTRPRTVKPGDPAKPWISEAAFDKLSEGEQLALMGNNYVDSDDDGWPDVCDTVPETAGRHCKTVEGSAGREKCTTGPDMIQKAQSSSRWSEEVRLAVMNKRTQKIGGQGGRSFLY